MRVTTKCLLIGGLIGAMFFTPVAASEMTNKNNDIGMVSVLGDNVEDRAAAHAQDPFKKAVTGVPTGPVLYIVSWQYVTGPEWKINIWSSEYDPVFMPSPPSPELPGFISLSSEGCMMTISTPPGFLAGFLPRRKPKPPSWLPDDALAAARAAKRSAVEEAQERPGLKEKRAAAQAEAYEAEAWERSAEKSKIKLLLFEPPIPGQLEEYIAARKMYVSMTFANAARYEADIAEMVAGKEDISPVREAAALATAYASRAIRAAESAIEKAGEAKRAATPSRADVVIIPAEIEAKTARAEAERAKKEAARAAIALKSAETRGLL